MEQKALNESPAGQIVQRPGAEDEIDLVELFYLLWGHAWQIILCLILGAGLALGYTKLLVTPLYQATSSIYIVSASNNSVVNLTDLQIGAQLTADYQELILSRPLLEDVIENLELTNGEGEPMSTAALSRMITITNTDDTRILKVTVTSPDEAIPPTQKSSPSTARNVVLGGLLGACLACGVLVLRYLMNDTFVTPDDVVKYLGVQPLAVIPEADLGDFNDKKRKNPFGRKGKK